MTAFTAYDSSLEDDYRVPVEIPSGGKIKEKSFFLMPSLKWSWLNNSWCSLYMKATTQWKSVELPLTFAGEKFRYKLYGRVYTGGIFVDDIRLYREQEISFIEGITSTKKQNVELFRLDGMSVRKWIRNDNPLPVGIYVLRQGEQTRKIIIR